MPIWRPEVYQGINRTHDYFEGWYFKHVDARLEETWSFIPGISRGARRAEGYAFIQAIEGATGGTWWFEYPLEAFSAARSRLAVRIGPNYFTDEGIELDLPGLESGGPPGGIKGSIRYGPTKPFPFRLLTPGVMGPYSFIPFMECRHGLVSADHRLDGSIVVDSRTVDFTGGRGYAEKDWGSSMPRSWIWMQSNNFSNPGNSFMLSLARVPWLGTAFNGFLLVALIGGRLRREASYTGARITSLDLADGRVRITIERKNLLVEVNALRAREGLLRAPVHGALSRRIAESVDAMIHIRWVENGSVLFEDDARKAGLEIVGDSESLRDPGAKGDEKGRRRVRRRP